MNNVNYSYLGGMPVTQLTLAFQQAAALAAFSAIAQMVGDKVILCGCVVNAANTNISDGWVSIAGEMLRFQGGGFVPTLTITDVPDNRVYFDGNSKDVYHTRYAIGSFGGIYNFSDFVPMPTLAEMTNMLASTGEVKLWAGTLANVPTGWTACNGAGLNAIDWPALYNVIGTQFGSDGVGRFLLPNMGGRVPLGLDATSYPTVGNTGGEPEHVLTALEMPSHQHESSWGEHRTDAPFGTVGGANKLGSGGTDNDNYSWLTGFAGGNAPHNNLQPFLVFIYIIKL